MRARISLLVENLLEKIKVLGGKKVAETFLSDNQDNLSTIVHKTNDIIPKTFASLEWLDLAKREIMDANKYLDQAMKSYNKKDYNSTVAYLIFMNSSIHKANGFAFLANERNRINIIFTNTSKLLNSVKKVASKWIDFAESTIDFYENIGYQKYSLHSRQILNQSKEYYSNKLYYIAIMNAVYAKTLVEYYTHEYLTYREYPSASSSCKTYLNWTELIMNSVYNAIDVDAPFAKSMLEQAQLHLQDELKEKDKSNASAIARLSIQESLIAGQQAQAVLDLRHAVEQDLNILYALPGASGEGTPGGLNMNQVGIVFLVIGIGMIVLGWFLRK